MINLAIPMALVVLIPLGARFMLSRGMTWELAFLMLPDLLIWFFVGMTSHLLKAAIHIKAAFGSNKITTAR